MGWTKRTPPDDPHPCVIYKDTSPSCRRRRFQNIYKNPAPPTQELTKRNKRQKPRLASPACLLILTQHTANVKSRFVAATRISFINSLFAFYSRISVEKAQALTCLGPHPPTTTRAAAAAVVRDGKGRSTSDECVYRVTANNREIPTMMIRSLPNQRFVSSSLVVGAVGRVVLDSPRLA